MERLKPLEHVQTLDSRNAAFVKLNAQTGAVLPLEIADYHRRLSAICLHDGVPEDIRSYLETVKNVCLYGWFVYPFFTLSVFLSYTAIEMALRRRFGIDEDSRRGEAGLKHLLRRAVTDGLISDDGFSAASRPARRQDSLDEQCGSGESEQGTTYTSRLIETIPHLRNHFAHPSHHTILVPGDATASLTIAAELINQLFRVP